eukprot:TRINITY_DN11416_c0_g2_i5.p1 TRINITY_DN11416_c0_g2~~TRINITY_DN11416_c0_g2_i5.p1  ORF type:complete len:203 (+),score=28.41 TRINITY_DN11416_c0_g2_i5:70-678(+)
MATVRIDFYEYYSPQTLALSQNAKVTDLLPLVRNRLAGDLHFGDTPHNIRLWLKMTDEDPSWFDKINGSIGLLPKTGELGKFLLPEKDCLSILVENVWPNSTHEEYPYEERPYEERPYEECPYEERPFEEPTYKERPYEERPYEERPYEERPYEERPYEERPYEQRPYEDDDEDYRRAIAASLVTASAETQLHQVCLCPSTF